MIMHEYAIHSNKVLENGLENNVIRVSQGVKESKMLNGKEQNKCG